MRILHIIDPSTPEDSLFTLACITRRVACEHQVLALGHASVMRAAVAAGVDPAVMRFARASGSWDQGAWRMVHRAFWDDGLSHVHCWGTWGMVAAAIPRNSPVVRLASLTALPAQRHVRMLKRAMETGAWFILCSSRAIMVEVLRMGLPRDRLAHVQPGVPEWSVPQISAGPLPDLLDLSADDQPTVFLGGTPQAHNRQDQGLWAAAILQQIYPRTLALIRLGRLHHAALQDQVRRLTEFAQDLPHPEMVHFIEPEVPVEAILAAADIMVFAPDADMDSTVMLRAMAAGVPVVATSAPGVAEIVGESKSAMVARVEEPWPLAAAVHQLLGNPEQAQEQVAAAGRRVETAFSSARLVERFASIYRQVYVAPKQPLAVPT